MPLTALPSIMHGWVARDDELPPDDVLDHAICGPATAALFDPVATERADLVKHQRLQRAAALCSRCPVMQDCLTYALTAPAGRVHGVYAGFYFTGRDLEAPVDLRVWPE